MHEYQRIMAVDDSDMNLLMIEEILGDQYELRCFSSGEEAMAAVEEWKPDVVLLDIMMPGMGGYETCRSLRSHPATEHVKIILISAKVDVEDRLIGYEHGADDYITKPFDADELLAKVKVFLRLKTAEEMNRIKKDILRLLSHETRTPLNGLLGYLEIVEDLRGDMDDTERELLAAARQSGRTLANLIEKCLMYSNLTSGVAVLQRQTWDLSERVAKVVQNNATAASRANSSISLAPASQALVAADSEYMDFAINALIENAIDHAPAGSEIAVAVHCDEKSATITVRDQGPGVSPEYFPYLFEPFMPEDIKHHTGGHGLSLAIVKKIIDLHDGAYNVVDSDGGGTCFEISFPVRNADAINSTLPAGVTVTSGR